jgi:phosphoribosylglycinamide formyltransferase 1
LRDIRLVVCGGFLRRLVIPPDFTGRVINIHPSLIPAFSGEGMYGMRVHEAVLAAGARETGCTVHLVDDQYDHGPVLARRRVAVLPGDTPGELARRVFAAETELLPAVINAFAAGEVEVRDGLPVMPPSFAGARP